MKSKIAAALVLGWLLAPSASAEIVTYRFDTPGVV